MQNKIKFSFVIPVYNRPLEITELLESMRKQTEKGFEVVIVEDGSINTSELEISKFRDDINIQYFYKENSGPGLSRNYGCSQANGNYYIILDSDCILPENYFSIVKEKLNNNYVDVFGGPDRAHSSFTYFQKAINYSMTSFLTTGGIRGGGENLDKFYPRSFNMGFSKEVFEKTKGFSNMRFGEDIDMSIRILKNNFNTRLFQDAYVYHKRRSNIRLFFKQVFNSGIARIQLYLKHPFSLKFVHLLPLFFLIGLISCICLAFFISTYFFLPLLFHMSLLLIDSTIKSKNLIIGLLSVLTSYIQVISYALGFILAFWRSIVLKRGSFSVFKRNFYK